MAIFQLLSNRELDLAIFQLLSNLILSISEWEFQKKLPDRKNARTTTNSLVMQVLARNRQNQTMGDNHRNTIEVSNRQSVELVD